MCADKMSGWVRAINNASNIEYIYGNILDMNFPDNSFDVIIIIATASRLNSKGKTVLEIYFII